MRYDGHQAGEPADDADADDAPPENKEDLKCGGKAGGRVGTSDYIETTVTDGAASAASNRNRNRNRSRNRSRTIFLGGEWKRTWRWLGWGWIGDARASLRGRRLFTLFAVVNLFNYLDRGVRVLAPV